MDFLIAFGHPLYQRFSRLVWFGVFVTHLFRSIVRNCKRSFNVLIQGTSFQIYFTCIQALPVVFFLALFVVAIFITQARSFAMNTDSAGLVANLFVVIVIRELAPLLTALVVVGRSGTAIASELASMAANQEINALKIMGVDPFYYIVVPRLLGIVVSMVCLSLTFSLLSMFFTMTIGFYMLDISPGSLLGQVTAFLTGMDLLLNLVKSAIFGLVISLVCTFCGFSAQGATTEIPQVTTHAVIASVFWCFVISALVTVLVY